MNFNIFLLIAIIIGAKSSWVRFPKHHRSHLESRHFLNFGNDLHQRPHTQEVGYGWHQNEHHEDHSVAGQEDGTEGVSKFISQFLGVMGPFLFPLPYVLALIPFAIPAIPLSIWVEMRSAQSHRPGGHHMPGHNGHMTPTPPPDNNGTYHPTAPSNSHPPGVTTFPTVPSSQKPNPTTDNPLIIETSSFSQMISSNTSNNSPPFPMNMSIGAPPNFPPTATLFPFPLFLNSSYLGEDYEEN